MERETSAARNKKPEAKVEASFRFARLKCSALLMRQDCPGMRGQSKPKPTCSKGSRKRMLPKESKTPMMPAARGLVMHLLYSFYSFRESYTQ